MQDRGSEVTENGNQNTLRIYVGKHCWSCDETVRLADEVRGTLNWLSVELIDLDAKDSMNYDNVFSTPTCVFNGRTIALGNPSLKELLAKVSALVV
jgi:hypothetical protein